MFFSNYIFRGDPNDGNVTRNDHDLVLLKLQNRAQFTNRVKPIRLPNLINDKINPENMPQCIVSGFGTIKDTRQSHILKYLTVPIVGRDQWYRFNIYLFLQFSFLVLEVIVHDVSKIFISVQAIGMVVVMHVTAIQVVH